MRTRDLLVVAQRYKFCHLVSQSGELPSQYSTWDSHYVLEAASASPHIRSSNVGSLSYGVPLPVIGHS